MSLSFSLRTCVVLGAVLSMPGQAQVAFPVSFEGVPIVDEPRKDAIESNLVAAAEHWIAHFDNAPASIEIILRIDYDAASGLGSGNSVTVTKMGAAGERTIYEQGMVHELRTGRDPNGVDSDVLIVLHPDYLSTFWLDPDPRCRTAPVPPDKLDAVTVFLHELGHAIAFNGWLDPSDGSLDGDALSTYDRHVRLTGSDFVFTGPNATRLYGDPVPLARTRNNYHHVGDSLRGADDPLADDLMNGVRFQHGRRYAISALDLAMLADASVPVKMQGLEADDITGKLETSSADCRSGPTHMQGGSTRR